MHSRFFDISYLLNTFRIKVRAFTLKLKNGSYPYDFFKNKPFHKKELQYDLKQFENYHSLSYLDNKTAQAFHSGERSVTQELIVGLVQFNELLNTENADYNSLLTLANQLENKAKVTDQTMIFYFDEMYHKFDLKGEYFSGIVQGKAASFFLKCYSKSGQEKYCVLAKKCLMAGWITYENNGVLRILENDLVWVEEYPSPKPSMVLNGFLFYITGLSEYLATEEDEEIKRIFENCLESILHWIPNYKVKNGLLYSMYHWDLCNVHYTAIMKYQFEHLYQITNIDEFQEFAEFTDSITNWKNFQKLITV